MCDPFATLATVSKDLQKKNIPVVEYGEILNARFGYPVCIQTFKWGVADSQVQLVSDVLLEHNIPLGGISTLNAESFGEWETSGVMHKCGDMRVHVVPLSSIGLSLDDCIEEVSSLSTEQKTLIPRSRPYFISLVRMLLTLPLGLRRVPTSSDLGLFLNYCVFPRLPDGEDEQTESDEHFQQRVEQALSCVHQWDWKAGEEKYLLLAERIVRDCSLLATLKE